MGMPGFPCDVVHLIFPSFACPACPEQREGSGAEG